MSRQESSITSLKTVVAQRKAKSPGEPLLAPAAPQRRRSGAAITAEKAYLAYHHGGDCLKCKLLELVPSDMSLAPRRPMFSILKLSCQKVAKPARALSAESQSNWFT